MGQYNFIKNEYNFIKNGVLNPNKATRQSEYQKDRQKAAQYFSSHEFNDCVKKEQNSQNCKIFRN